MDTTTTARVLLIIGVVCVLIPVVTSQCTPLNPNVTPGPNDPPLPQIPNTFQTKVEANIQDKQFTINTEEYFSDIDNKATVKLIRQGDITTLIFDYNTNELFYVKDNRCQKSNLTTDVNTLLFGDDMVHGIPHIVTAKAALHFLRTSGQVYKGQRVVRGILTDHWQTCLQWPKLTSVFTLDYFFTAKGWVDPWEFPQIPVRAIASGVQTQQNGQAYVFNHTYDYFDFRPELTEDDTIFETPSGVICPGRISTRNITTLPNKFHYRTEIIQSQVSTISTTDVWYDNDYKLVRYDYKNPSPIPPYYTINPLSEVHDFNTGVRYVRDKLTGNCTISSLGNNSFDVVEPQGRLQANSSWIAQLKNPLQFFALDGSYTYSGKRKARGVVCDVFGAYRTNYQIGPLKINATFEYYFLADLYTEYPDDGSTTPIDIPYMLLINVVSPGEALPDFTIIYNFLDFDTGHPDMAVFDITPCYSNQANLRFKVRFPGSYKTYTDNQIRQQAHVQFALAANVTNIRVQNVQLEYDNSNVYLLATLLDRAPPFSQFTLSSTKTIQLTDDLYYGYVANRTDCAKYCVNNPHFVCNAFEWCYNTPTNCRISKGHISDGAVVPNGTKCDHYSRTVTGPLVQEIGIFEAYSNLRQAVYTSMLNIQAFQADGTTTFYNSENIEIVFGWLSSDPFPAVDSQFSYLLEVVVPKIRSAYTAHIWYDYNYKLVRYDMALQVPGSKFHTGNPMSIINDFQTGLAYNIDGKFGNCSITPISNTTFDSNMNRNDFLKNGAYVVQMKNPLDFFYVDNVFKYAGQKTVRGIRCIVFEAITDSFHLTGYNQKFTSRLQFYFEDDTWSVTPSGSSVPVRGQPIQMDVSSVEIGLFLTYNFYNFNLEDPDMRHFDITPCFGGNQQRHFIIRFPGHYHPTLDTTISKFKKTVQILLAEVTMASPIRFQRTEVTYNSNYIYVIGTVVDTTPFIVDFTKTSAKANPHKGDATYTGITSEQDCARNCRVAVDFPCESFDYCSSTSTCILSKDHVDDGAKLTTSATCDHFSRTVNSTLATQPNIDILMLKLNDAVYKGVFQIPIMSGGNTTIYVADRIRDNIARSSRDPTSSQVLQHFSINKNNVILRHNNARITGISVDECADACLTEESFDCQSFDFCYRTGDCLMSKVHPDSQPNLEVPNQFCDLYSRTYLDKYTASPGQVALITADKEVDAINSDNLCAKLCSQNSDFPCKSFQYCFNTKQCNLMKKHQLDIPAQAIVASPTCSFYTRNYIDDFQKKARSTMTFSQTLDFTNVSVDDCAKLCVTTEATNCLSFAFCNNNTSLCRLTSAHPKVTGGVVMQDVCDLYLRKYFPGGAPIVVGPTPKLTTGHLGPPGSKANTGYSAGAMAGVAIGLFLPGLAVGAAIMFFFRRKQEEKTKEDMDMHQIISNEEKES